MLNIYGIPALSDDQPIGDVGAWSRSLANTIAKRDAAILDQAGKIKLGNPLDVANVTTRLKLLEDAIATANGTNGNVPVTINSTVSTFNSPSFEVHAERCEWSGGVYGKNGGQLPAGSTTLIDAAPAACRPKSDKLRPIGTDADVRGFIQITTAGKVQLWLSAATGAWIHLSPLNYSMR